MSKLVAERVALTFGDRILESRSFRGDEELRVAPKDWVEVATFLRDDPTCKMDHFTDLTAIDWPEREPNRFDVLVLVRSLGNKHRIRVRTQIPEGVKLPTLSKVWAGADWAEREVWDMFGIDFEGHPDMRRILMYDEFVGHPLRKDYPIEKAQPLVPYREVDGLEKLPPFGVDMGQPFARLDWNARIQNADHQVSPAIATQVGERRMVSDSEIAIHEQAALAAATPPAAAPTGAKE